MGSFVIHNDKEIKGFFGSYRFLSNFCKLGVYVLEAGYGFPSVEHAYQFSKFLFSSRDDAKKEYEKIILMSAGEIKKWGRSFKINKDWNKIKYELMAGLVFDKFFKNSNLREQLLKTDDRYLEETNNWHDNYWGNCICNKCLYSSAEKHQNNLGKILMKVRDFWQ